MKERDRMNKLAFVFSGQGSQYIGMGQGIYNEYKTARETFEEVSDYIGFDVRKVCFDGPLTVLLHTKNSHISILTNGIAAFRVFMEETNCEPQFCAGHSLGEYIALTCAGVFSLRDVIKLISYRVELADLAQKDGGGMTIVENIESDMVDEICMNNCRPGNEIYVSCYTTPTQTTLSGLSKALYNVEESIIQKGGQITPLIGCAPYHSPLMEPYTALLRKELSGIVIQKPCYPIVANVSGKLYEETESIAENLVKHFVKPVQWIKTIAFLAEQKIDRVVEMGPKRLLTNTIGGRYPEMEAFCMGEKKSRKAIAELFNKDSYMIIDSQFPKT